MPNLIKIAIEKHAQYGKYCEIFGRDFDNKIENLKEQISEELVSGKHPELKQTFTIEAIIALLSEEKNTCFATGSRVFGCSTSESDYDIVILTKPKNSIQGIREQLGEKYGSYCEEESNYNNGSKMYFGHYNNKCINLIPLDIHDFLYWKLATESIANASRINPDGIKNKTIRVATFEMMKGLFRIIVGNDVNEKTLEKYEKFKDKDVNVLVSKFQYEQSKKKKGENHE